MADVKNGTSRGVDEGSSNSYAPITTTSNHTLGVVIDAIIEPRRTEPHPKHRMKKVPLTMRNNEKNKGYFGPRVVSIGPYHHGKEEELQEVKKIKPIVAQLFISSSGIDMNEFCKKLLAIVDDARSSYLEGSIDKYSNEEFAEKMFFDGFFVSIVIEFSDPNMDRPIDDELVKCFGYYVVYLLSNDPPGSMITSITTPNSTFGSLKESIDMYSSRNQRQTQEARERAELLGRAEAQAMQSARNSSRMLEESYATGVAILAQYAGQRDRLKRAQRKALDVLNTVGTSNFVLKTHREEASR